MMSERLSETVFHKVLLGRAVCCCLAARTVGLDELGRVLKAGRPVRRGRGR